MALNWPPTRTCTWSSGVCTAPADSTAFCWPSWASTWLKSSPSCDKALLRDFDKQLFVLHAKLLDLGHIAHAQQLLAHIVGKGLQLCVAEAFGPSA